MFIKIQIKVCFFQAESISNFINVTDKNFLACNVSLIQKFLTVWDIVN